MQRHIPLAGLCLAVFMVMTGMGMAAVALPEKYLALAGSMRSSGWLASSFAVAYVACQYPCGRWADAYGFRPVLAAGCLLVALAAAVFHHARTPEVVYLGRFIQGAGEAPLWAAAPALLGRLYPAHRGRVMGLYNAVFHVGLMSGPLAGAWVAARSGVDPFLVFCGAALAAMAVITATLHGAEPQTRESSGAQARPGTRLVLSRSLWPLALALPVFGAVYGLLVSCLPVWLAAAPGATHQGLGAFLFAAYAGVAAAQFVAGGLSDRLGRGWFMAGGLALAGLGLGLLLLGGAMPAWACAAVLGLGLGTFAVASMALVNESCPQGAKGAASGVYYLVWGLGYFAGPLAVNAVGLRLGGLAIAFACCASALCVAVPSLMRRG